jgi:hypothetical protein
MVFSVLGPNTKSKTKQVSRNAADLNKHRYYYFGIDFVRYLESLYNVEFMWDSLDNTKRYSMNVNGNSNRFIILKKVK